MLVRVTPGRKMGMDGRLRMLRYIYNYIYIEFLLAVIVTLCSLIMVYIVKSTHVLFHFMVYYPLL